MNESTEKESVSPIVPLLVGAAVGGALAYLFATESNAETGGKLTETLSKSWESLKEKLPFIEDEINSFKEKIMDTVASNLKAESDHANEAVQDV